MELKEGMYVRTKDGEIGIVISGERIAFAKDYAKIEYLVIGNEIVNASYKIISLIEDGDYVNGYRVYSGGKKHFDYILTWDDVENYYMKIPLHTVNIKSIVTKEQFESMSYKVGD